MMRLYGMSWYDVPIMEGGFKFIGRYRGHIVAMVDKFSRRSLDRLVPILLRKYPGNRVIVLAKQYEEEAKEAGARLGIKVFKRSGDVEVSEELAPDEHPERLLARRLGYYALRMFMRLSPELKSHLEAAKQHYLTLASLGKTSEVTVNVKVTNPPRELWPIASNYLDHMMRAIFESLGYSYESAGHGPDSLSYEFVHADTLPKLGEEKEDSPENSVIGEPPEGWAIKRRLVRDVLGTGRRIFYEEWVSRTSKTLLVISSTPLEYQAVFSIGVYHPEEDRIVSDVAPIEIVRRKIPEEERALDDRDRSSFTSFIQEVRAKMAQIGGMNVDEPIRWRMAPDKNRGDVINP